MLRIILIMGEDIQSSSKKELQLGSLFSREFHHWLIFGDNEG